MSLDLEAIEKRALAAKTGPWEEVGESADDVPALIKAVEMLRGALAEAVTWDGHDEQGVPAVWLELARAALEATAPPATRSGTEEREDRLAALGYETEPPERAYTVGDAIGLKRPASRSEARRLEVQRGENIAPVSAVSDASPAAIGPRKGQRRDVDAASSTVARMAQEAATSFKPGEVEDAAERDGPHGILVGESPEPGRMDGSREQNRLGKTEPGQDRPSSPSPPPPCVTHHHACDCREAEFAALRVRLEQCDAQIAEDTKRLGAFADEVVELSAKLSVAAPRPFTVEQLEEARRRADEMIMKLRIDPPTLEQADMLRAEIVSLREQLKADEAARAGFIRSAEQTEAVITRLRARLEAAERVVDSAQSVVAQFHERGAADGEPVYRLERDLAATRGDGGADGQ